MGNTSLSYIKIIGIAYNSGPNTSHGGTITPSDAYHKATKWFLHHMNDMVLFRKYIQSLDTLELNVHIAFSPFITIEEVCIVSHTDTTMCGSLNL
jgi:hypothetical protein